MHRRMGYIHSVSIENACNFSFQIKNLYAYFYKQFNWFIWFYQFVMAWYSLVVWHRLWSFMFAWMINGPFLMAKQHEFSPYRTIFALRWNWYIYRFRNWWQGTNVSWNWEPGNSIRSSYSTIGCRRMSVT